MSETLKEKDIQRACLDYLDLKRILYLRLNAGDVFRPGAEGKMYKVKGCPKGTSDLLILAYTETRKVVAGISKVWVEPRPIFVECKSTKGKQTPEQKEFESMVKYGGYEYYLIRSIDELIEVTAL